MSPYQVEFGPAAARQFRKLPAPERARIRTALEALARDVERPGRIGGKRVKTLEGTDGKFHRLRVGDHRVMYVTADEERTLFVMGIIHRRDLERWLRTR